MRIKLFRWQEVRQLRLSPPTLPVHGFGFLKGTVRKEGVPLYFATVTAYEKANGIKIWHTKTDKNGKFVLRNLQQGLVCFVVAEDPENSTNAQVKDMQVVK